MTTVVGMKNFYKSLTFKIGLSVILVEAIVLSIIGAYYVSQFSTEIDKALVNQIDVPGTLITQGQLDFTAVSDEKIMERLVGEQLRESAIIGINQKVYYSLNPDHIGQPASQVFGTDFMRQIDIAAPEAKLIREADALIKLKPLQMDNGKLTGFLYIKAGLESLEQRKREILITFVLGSLVCLLLTSIAIIHLFNSTISNRLKKLLQVSQRVEAGDLTVRIHGSRSPDEIGILQDGMNAMVTQLAEIVGSLEERVQSRTQQLEIALAQNQQILELEQQRAVELAEAKSIADSANQAKSEFLANMSHELRTPLNGILGYAQILQSSQSLPEKERRGVNIIHQCGTHLLTLINDVLDLAKVEARKMEVVPTEFHFSTFLQGVAEICRIRAEQKHITFIYEKTADLPVGIRADEKRLRQVLINLLGNAIKFTDQGSVTFLVERIGSPTPDSLQPGDNSNTAMIRFSVKDTGVGMTPEQLEKIFLPFEQVGDVKKQSEGTGLGLTISQQIVELMDSRLQVQSQHGKGSTFWFDVVFPEATEWGITPTNSDQGAIRGYQGKRRRVLVVDDRWENRSVVVNLLEPLGFEVVEVNNGREGLDAAIAHPPDVIITDLMMPVMDGYQLLRQIRASATLREVVAIASSASVFESNQQQAIDDGANVFLPKPIEAKLLLQTLQEQLQLNWIYQRAEVQPTPPDADLVQTFETKPSEKSLQQLLTLVQDGDIQGILDLAEQLRLSNPALESFSHIVTQLTHHFQLQQLQTLLEKHLIG